MYVYPTHVVWGNFKQLLVQVYGVPVAPLFNQRAIDTTRVSMHQLHIMLQYFEGFFVNVGSCKIRVKMSQKKAEYPNNYSNHHTEQSKRRKIRKT